jgi:hypothetical protein
VLRGDDTFAHIDGGELIVADAPIKNLIFACGSIPIPLVARVGQRDRERPAIFARLECEVALAGGHEGVPFVVPLQKCFSSGFISDGIAGRNDLLAAWAKDCSQLGRIPVTYSLNESTRASFEEEKVF